MAEAFAGPAADLRTRLTGWTSPEPEQEALRDRYLAFLAAHGPAGLRRDGGAEHVTASCVVLSPDRRRTLLCFHRKGRFWVQPGGHLEAGDVDVPAAARREAAEETGLAGLVPVPGVLDLDRHRLGDGFGRCRAHWDVGVVALADPASAPRVSAESEQVAWFDLDDLPAPLADRVALRTRRLRDLVAG